MKPVDRNCKKKYDTVYLVYNPTSSNQPSAFIFLMYAGMFSSILGEFPDPSHVNHTTMIDSEKNKWFELTSREVFDHIEMKKFTASL